MSIAFRANDMPEAMQDILLANNHDLVLSWESVQRIQRWWVDHRDDVDTIERLREELSAKRGAA